MRTLNRHLVTGGLWVAVYLALTLAPLGLILLSAETGGQAGTGGRGFWREFSVALGFVGLAMMGLQFVLTARFRVLKAPFGSDVIYAFHRQISIISFLLVLAHPIILLVIDPEDMLRRLNPATMPWPARLGVGSVICLITLIVISVWRKRLRLGYDTWRRTHAVLAVGAIALGIGHILYIGHYLATPTQRALWVVYSLAWVALIVWVRLVKPMMEARRPWRVAEVRAERGGCTTIVLEPDPAWADRATGGLGFQPGQFAWITMFSSPFSDREHPFSLSSSAEKPLRPEFTIKRAGDFTARVAEAKVGEPVYLDGPFGALSADRTPNAKGFVLIAGGVGITPMMSHIRTFADRGDQRPLILLYGSKSFDDITFREQLDELQRSGRVNLKVVHVLSVPPGDWTGERGFMTPDLLDRHLPPDARDGSWEVFICGPTPMMESVETALSQLGLPLGSYHSEQFDLA